MIPTLSVLRRVAAALPADRRERLRDGVRLAYDMAHLAQPAPIALRTGLWPRLTILAWPDAPSRYQAFSKLCAVNGYRVVSRPDEPHDLFWHYRYHLDEGAQAPPEAGVNARCRDVSKQRVGRVFAEAFGYALAVDPRTHEGPILEKPDRNHTFDGRVLQGPLPPEEIRADRVYQRYVDTVVGDQALDLRVPVYGGVIPVVYEKRRPAGDGLKDVRTARMVAPEAAFTEAERAGIVRFVRAMDLDYAEVDVLRDVRDGRIYIVDANNTPAGPPKQMTDAEIGEALRILSPAFTALVESARRPGVSAEA